MIYILMLVLAVIASVVAVQALAGYISIRKSRYRTLYVNQNKVFNEAEIALRNIAGGNSGNPVLEAQIALDEINNYYNTKEIA